MAVLTVIVIFVLIGLVVLIVGAPVRRATEGRASRGKLPARALPESDGRARRYELEAARESKYREIRDAEMDFRTGKLSAADYGTLDRELRAEALEILDSLQALEAAEQPQNGPAGEA